MGTAEQPGKLPAPLRAQLDAAHSNLLTIHKMLLDHERARYERTHGRIGTPGELLQLVIHDPWFAWLRPMSMLIAQIDELVSSKEPPIPGEGEALMAQVLAFLMPDEAGTDFQRGYYRVLQESPAAALMHGQWRLAMLKQ